MHGLRKWVAAHSSTFINDSLVAGNAASQQNRRRSSPRHAFMVKEWDVPFFSGGQNITAER
jgi:hypothetical protein